MKKEEKISNLESTEATPQSFVRKIVFSETLDKRAMVIAAQYFPEFLFNTKKDDVLSKVVDIAINHMYENKLLKEIK